MSTNVADVSNINSKESDNAFEGSDDTIITTVEAL